MDMRKWFFLSVIFLALVVGGCGGNGNGGGTAMMPGDDDDEPMACPAGQTRNADGDCAAPPPVVMPPSMALVNGIVTANDKEHSATAPAPYSHTDRPGKGGDTDAGVVVPLKNDGTFGDVAISTVSDNVVTQSGGDLEMSEDMMPPSVGSFANGAVFTRTKDDVTDTVYVYETKAAPTAQAWDVRYESGGDGLTGITTITPDNPGDTTTNQKFTTLSFTGNVSDFAKRFASNMFPSAPSQTNTYYAVTAYDALTPEQKNEATRIRGQKFDGTFEGIPGEYSCTGDLCTAETNGQGYVSTLAGTWMFTPADIAVGRQGHMVQSVVSDTDYLSFGYWVQKEDDDGDETIGVGTFVTGSVLSATYIGGMTTLVGTAEYEGKAGGKFVRKTLAPDGAATITDGGVFTADANLTARFGGADISFNDQFTVVGTVDNFQDGDGDMIDSKWSVMLGKADFSTYDGDTVTTKDAINSGTITGFSGTASGGGPAGSWGGSFYGDPKDSEPADGGKDYPSSIGGEFDAHFPNGHVLGAFGATRDK